ncbi:MAG: hypothetical protein H6671_03870 [Anaerolineaceae bacterium]|nr:hypothetical protein [Anaerolineaceae bacterium]
MQISRHWRLNSQRYRLQGVRYENGEVSLQARPAPLNRDFETAEEVLATRNRVERVSVRGH